jgi:hypothetical protein
MLEKNTDWSMVKCENGMLLMWLKIIYGGWLYILKANVYPVY